MSDVNYNIAPQNPMPGMLQALQFGSALGQIRDQRSQAQAQAEAQAQKQAQIQAAFNAVHENPSAENYIALSNLLPPEQAKSIREGFAVLDENTQKATLNESARIFAALEAGQPEIALNFMQQKVDAYKNANNEKGAKDLQMLIDLAKTGEEGQKTVADMFGMNISLMTGGTEAMEGLTKFAQERRTAAAEPTAQAKRLADIGFTDAQTNQVLATTRKLGLEADQLTNEIEAAKNALPKGPELSSGAEQLVNGAVLAAAKANTLSKQYATLATDFEQAITTAGTGARISEQIVRMLGTEKEPTALRQEFLRMRNTAVLEMLPPGVASDKDVELALAAFPSETSSPANIASFLRGMSKLQAYEGAMNNAKSEWIQQNGTLGTAKVPMTIGNRQVETGDRFTEFIEVYVPNTSVLGRGGASGASFGAVPTGETGAANIVDLKAFLKTKWPAEAAKIDSLDMAGLQREYPKTIAQYQPAQSATTTPQTRTEVDF
jgi:hypothetical protein